MLVVLRSKELGPLEIVNKPLLDEMGGTELLQSHSVFLVGSPNIAAELARNGKNILVGLTSRYSKNHLYSDRVASGSISSGIYEVTHGRQVFFPLPDGTWLGVKGSGQNIDPTKPPIYIDDGPVVAQTPRYHRGLVSSDEAKSAKEAVRRTKEKGFHAISFLGFRRIREIPDGKGGWIPSDEIRYPDGRSVDPMLSFNHSRTPFRLIELPELLKNDPELKRTLTGLMPLLRESVVMDSIKSSQDVISYREWTLFIAQMLGKQYSAKFNEGLYKRTINAQDFNLAGEETDIEDFVTFEEYKQYLEENRPAVIIRSRHQIVLNYGIDVQNLLSYAGIFAFMTVKNRQLLDPEKFPTQAELMHAFFKAYFTHLDSKKLKIWRSLLDGEKKSSSSYDAYSDFFDSLDGAVGEDTRKLIAGMVSNRKADSGDFRRLKRANLRKALNGKLPQVEGLITKQQLNRLSKALELTNRFVAKVLEEGGKIKLKKGEADTIVEVITGKEPDNSDELSGARLAGEKPVDSGQWTVDREVKSPKSKVLSESHAA